MLTLAQGIDNFILVAIWVTVCLQEFFEGSIIIAKYIGSLSLCLLQVIPTSSQVVTTR